VWGSILDDVRPARDLVHFGTEAGTFLAGDRYLCFQRDPTLGGFALWGDHDARTITSLMAILDVQLDHATARHVTIADLSRLGRVDASAYVPLAQEIASRAERLGRLVSRHVLIRPPGPTGLLIAGFYNVARPPYPFNVVATAVEAADALGDPSVLDLLAEVASLIDQTTRPSETARLRQYLRSAMPPPEVDDAARALGLSARTLQRRLREQGTSFRVERLAVQLDRTKELLLSSDSKIIAIAAEVGFASPAHLSTSFQKATGDSPAAWRARHRR
jgi:AraC-like DNA-binding protein